MAALLRNLSCAAVQRFLHNLGLHKEIAGKQPVTTENKGRFAALRNGGMERRA